MKDFLDVEGVPILNLLRPDYMMVSDKIEVSEFQDRFIQDQRLNYWQTFRLVLIDHFYGRKSVFITIDAFLLNGGFNTRHRFRFKDGTYMSEKKFKQLVVAHFYRQLVRILEDSEVERMYVTKLRVVKFNLYKI